MWKRCLAGEQDALDYMQAYNIKDVEILEQVYLKLRPWIKNHPNISLYLENEDETCPHCGSSNLADTGTFSYTNVSVFFQCAVHGLWRTGTEKNIGLSERKKKDARDERVNPLPLVWGM